MLAQLTGPFLLKEEAAQSFCPSVMVLEPLVKLPLQPILYSPFVMVTVAGLPKPPTVTALEITIVESGTLFWPLRWPPLRVNQRRGWRRRATGQQHTCRQTSRWRVEFPLHGWRGWRRHVGEMSCPDADILATFPVHAPRHWLAHLRYLMLQQVPLE